jgi:WD40-like Beta Propeller Repeat
MTERLSGVLVEMAQQAPDLRLPADLWQRGRRRRRTRRLSAVVACLLIVAAVLVLPWRAEPLPVADGGVRIPRTVAEPYLWQQSYWAAPNGPALLVFGTSRSLNLETAMVVVGRDGSYRIMYQSPGLDFGSLSPDGRYALRQGLLDLSTGKTRYKVPGAWGPWTWAADSRSAVMVLQHDGPETTYPDGTFDDGKQPDDVVVLDVATGRTHTVYHGDADETAAAFSPDGRQLAITVGLQLQPQRLLILDAATGAVNRDIALTDRQRLAGPAAWTPDGRSILLTYGEQCPNADYSCAGQKFHLQRVDAATGTMTDEARRSRPGSVEVIGWRDGQPVADYSIGSTCAIVQLAQSGETVLHEQCPMIPRDLVEQASWDGPELRAPVWQAQWWFYAVLLLLLAAAGLVTWRLTRRTRRRARATADA